MRGGGRGEAVLAGNSGCPESRTFLAMKCPVSNAFTSNRLTSITIGPNVTLTTGREEALFGSGFEGVYNNGGKRAGTYTRANANSETWTRSN